ncbi:hypothetical protein [Bradyrhizobium sp. LB11.1]|uniref:hypothetical protein n=1 Tax=Bradyrhizobium sp. LB11.1 TaxID=3156326 RepID=UPI003395DAE9
MLARAADDRAILLVVLLGGSVALSMLGARFRDIGSAIVSGLQFVFFLAPAIWTGDGVRGTAFAWLTRANPFATLRRADEMKAVA